MSDMAGFTRLTRERGILYFLCQFRRAAHAAESIIARHRALFSKTAADNIIATFESVRDAMAAASEFATLHFDEARPCVGVGYGKILQLEDDVFGDEINVTYKLGEDLAQVGEVLVTDSAAKRAEGFTLEGPLTMDLGGVDVRYFRLKT